MPSSSPRCPARSCLLLACLSNICLRGGPRSVARSLISPLLIGIATPAVSRAAALLLPQPRRIRVRLLPRHSASLRVRGPPRYCHDFCHPRDLAHQCLRCTSPLLLPLSVAISGSILLLCLASLAFAYAAMPLDIPRSSYVVYEWLSDEDIARKFPTTWANCGAVPRICSDGTDRNTFLHVSGGAVPFLLSFSVKSLRKRSNAITDI
jgi:hypothetical protein